MRIAMDNNKRLPDSELAVMLVIWDSKEQIHTGDIMRGLELAGKKPGLSMVQSYLNRLCDKGFLRCEKIGRLNHYIALVGAEEYKAREAASFVERLYEGSPTKLFASLIQSNTLSEDDLAEMKRILDEGGDTEC